MGLFSSIGAFGRRSMIGAGVGAGLGFANTGDLGGVMGGAIGGAAAGGFGGGYMSSLAKRGTFSNLAGRGMQGISGLATKARPFVRSNGNIFGSAGVRAVAGINRLGTSGAGFIGNNAVAVNKWGGRAASAAGIGAAAYIGSSVIGSNRGY